MAFWKDSLINRLSNIINRNRSAAKISQVLCFNDNMKMSQAKILHVETSSPNCGIARAALSAQEYEETKIEALPMPLKYSILIW